MLGLADEEYHTYKGLDFPTRYPERPGLVAWSSQAQAPNGVNPQSISLVLAGFLLGKNIDLLDEDIDSSRT